MVKLVLLFKKRGDLTTEQFLAHWKEVHIPLVLKVPGIKRYVISPFVGSPSGQDDFDGMAELWFDSHEAADAALATEATIATGIDSRNFIQKGSLRRFFAEEETIVS